MSRRHVYAKWEAGNTCFCLMHAARYEETLLWAARALQFAPDDPLFPKVAYLTLDHALKNRLRRARPDLRIPPADGPEPFDFNAGGLLRIEERSLFLTIVAHYKESNGDSRQANRQPNPPVNR